MKMNFDFFNKMNFFGNFFQALLQESHEFQEFIQFLDFLECFLVVQLFLLMKLFQNSYSKFCSIRQLQVEDRRKVN